MVYLELAAEDAAARGGYGGERYEQQKFQRKVRVTAGARAPKRIRLTFAV